MKGFNEKQIRKIYANEIFMELTSDIAEQITKGKMKGHDDPVFITDIDGTKRFSETAQDIFNEEYDNIQADIIRLFEELLYIIR